MKAKSASPSGRNGMAMPPQTVDDYIAVCPEPGRSALKKMRTAIRSVLPREATEVISYKMPAFKLKKVLVWYAAFTDHCSLFPTSAPIEACKEELAGFTTSKGTVRFPLDKPLPIALIKQLVRVRLDQSAGKAKG
jgi:uncharacterized protein YdhG (YjbR/CyaY superfamily)